MEIDSKKIKDRVGQRYGSYTVLEYAGKKNYDVTLWKCVCDCGQINIATSTNLAIRKQQNVKSCKSCIGLALKNNNKNRVYKKSQDTDTVIYKGISFNRYPNSKHPSHRRYYRPHSGHIKNGIDFLHREIWRDHHGLIPEGHHVHHIDGNSLNNSIENLGCIPSADHHKEHAQERSLRGSSEKQLKHLENIRELTKAWHASEEGREWHRSHVKNSIGKRKEIQKVCIHCNESFCAIDVKAKCCSNKCFNKWYALNKRIVKKHTRVCPICEKTYLGRKAQKFCSKSCSQKNRWMIQRSRPI